MKRRAAILFVLGFVLIGGDCDDDDDIFFIAAPPPPPPFDLDVDGFADLVYGAPGHDGLGAAGSERGAVFVHFGSASGPSLAPDLSIFGAEDGARFGASVAFAGDVNGRGAPDLLVGAPGDDADGNATEDGADRGRAFLYFGGPAMDAVADLVFSGAEDGARFGQSVARVGDTNRDGFTDLVIGAPGDDGDDTPTEDGIDRGRAFFYYGFFNPDAFADVAFTGTEDGAQLGFSVSSAGDVNAGGAVDIAVGAPFDDGDDTPTDDGGDRGRAFVFYGGSLLDATPDLVFTGDEDDARLGAALSDLSDVNADGVHDLLVGAPLHDAGGGAGADRGEAYVFFGAPGTPDTVADLTLSGATDGGAFGSALSRGRDVDGDGGRDFLVGAPLEDPGGRVDAGSAYWFRGGAVLDDVFDLALDGEEAGARFGAAVAIPGDLDGDGRDLVVGAPLDDADGDATDDGFERGTAILFSGGALLDALPEDFFDGDHDDAEAGSALAD